MKTKHLAFLGLAVGFLLAASVATAGTIETEEVVYSVNSYVHGTMPEWSTITMLRGSTLAPLKTLTLLRAAHTVAVTPDNERLWVTQPPPNRITVIDGSTFEVFTNIDLGDIVLYRPMGVAITPDGRYAYVTYEGTGEVSIWDAHTAAYVDTFDVGGSPAFILFTPDGSKAYVVDYQTPQVVAVRVSDHAILATLPFGGHALQDAVVSPDGTRVYVANRDMNQIEAIRTVDNEVLMPIATDPLPRGIGISPDGRYLFVGHWLPTGRLSMIRRSDRVVCATLDVFGNARRIAVRSDGTRLFVSDHDNDRCVAVNVSGETLTVAQAEDLNAIPGFLASPVGIATGTYRRPVPDILINGMSGTVRLTRADRARLTLSLDSNGRRDPADWWLAGIAPFGLYFWTPAGWGLTRRPSYQGPLADVPSFSSPEVSLATWPTGTYVFGFAVDVKRDGAISRRFAYSDMVVMILSD